MCNTNEIFTGQPWITEVLSSEEATSIENQKLSRSYLKKLVDKYSEEDDDHDKKHIKEKLIHLLRQTLVLAVAGEDYDYLHLEWLPLLNKLPPLLIDGRNYNLALNGLRTLASFFLVTSDVFDTTYDLGLTIEALVGSLFHVQNEWASANKNDSGNAVFQAS